MLARLLCTVAFAADTLLAAPIEAALRSRGNLPTPVSASTAKTYLAALTVAAEVNSPAYVRDYFKTWITISGTCDTREYVLKRDGANVQTSSACAATSGSWYSDYDGATWTAAGDVDIDHVVPLVYTLPRLIVQCVLTTSAERSLGIRRPLVDRRSTPGICERVCTAYPDPDIQTDVSAASPDLSSLP